MFSPTTPQQKTTSLSYGLWLLVILFMTLLPSLPQASNMSLNKHRILLDETTRRDDLLVFNPSSDFQSYRVSVEDFIMDDKGQLHRTKAFDASAKALLRVGPRLGRNIAPNQSQKFRVMLRKNNKDGEFRSHIVIEALLPPLPTDSQGVYARPNIKYSIPVIVRKGSFHATVAISSAKIVTNPNNNQPYLEMNFQRSGNRSIFGNLRAYLQHNPEQILVKANSIGIYPEVEQRLVRLAINNPLPHSGILVIEFAEKPEYGGDLTASYQLSL